MSRFKMLFVSFVVAFLAVVSASAQAQGPQETLRQYVADLQKNPSDMALREKIIKLTLTMNPAPAAPKDVIRHEGAAEFAFKNAKTSADFADAAKEYEEALLLAPWLAQDYFNCGVAYEKAEKFEAAVRNFNLYLTAAPDAKDANDVLKRIGGLEYAANKASKESSSQVVAVQDQKKPDDWLQKIDGRRYRWTAPNGNDGVIDVRGKILVEGGFGDGGYQESGRFEIKGREFTVSFPAEFQRISGRLDHTFIISEDGYQITERHRFSDGDSREYIYLWQR